jgi:uncharacterized protein
VILALLVAKGLMETAHAAQLREAALAPGAGEAARKAWASASFTLAPPASLGQSELIAYRGGFLEALKARAFIALIMQTVLLVTESLPEAIAQMMIGIGLYRLGFFTLGWSSRAYGLVLVIGWGIGIPVSAWLAWQTAAGGFEPIQRQTLSWWAAIPRPLIAVAHASALLLLVRSGALAWLVNRLAAAGRMALSNYLGASILTSFLFCGYGFGLYGHLQRYQLYGVVVVIWAIMLAWSLPWMQRFQYGPFEWLWRTLVKGRAQPMLRRTAASGA